MESTQPTPPGSSPDEMFPVLSAEQQARVLTHGRIRKVTSGEIVVELNQQPTKVFVVVEGKLEAWRVSDNKEEVFAICGAGMFTGDLNLLSGQRALARIRAAELSELIEIDREALLNLVQNQPPRCLCRGRCPRRHCEAGALDELRHPNSTLPSPLSPPHH